MTDKHETRIKYDNCSTAKGNKGVMLILIMFLLLIMVSVGAMFIFVSRASRNIDRISRETLRARLLARSGFEYAVSRLRTACVLHHRYSQGQRGYSNT